MFKKSELDYRALQNNFISSKKKRNYQLVYKRWGYVAMVLGTDVRLEPLDPTPFIYCAKWKNRPIGILSENCTHFTYIHILGE